MKNWPVRKLIESIIGIIFLGFGVAFFIKQQYSQSLISIGLLIIVFKLDSLKKFALSPNSGIETEFLIPDENIKRDIKENNQPVNKRTFADFREIEDKILQDVLMKIGGTMKRQIHFVYGSPDKPEFIFTPDATIQTDKELIFIEVKYILKETLVKDILNSGIQQLKMILEKFSPAAGDKRVVAKLILAGTFDMDTKAYKVPKNIDLEFYRL